MSARPFQITVGQSKL